MHNTFGGAFGGSFLALFVFVLIGRLGYGCMVAFKSREEIRERIASRRAGAELNTSLNIRESMLGDAPQSNAS